MHISYIIRNPYHIIPRNIQEYYMTNNDKHSTMEYQISKKRNTGQKFPGTYKPTSGQINTGKCTLTATYFFLPKKHIAMLFHSRGDSGIFWAAIRYFAKATSKSW